MIRQMFWYEKKRLNHLETSLLARKGSLIVFYQDKKTRHIDGKKTF